MANEIANISHAGLIVQFFEDDGAAGVDYSPIILGAWGVKESSLIRLTDKGVGEPGQYQIELDRPGSGSIDVSGEFFTKLDSLVLTQGLALPNFIGAILFVDVLTFDPGAVALNRPINLPVLVMQVTNEDGDAEDANGILNVEVRSAPQQV